MTTVTAPPANNTIVNNLHRAQGQLATPQHQRPTGGGTADRFLTMLVAQMQNQDPLNPMDNAQVTSQMAQINTVSGLEQVNTSVLSH
jgi:flagellar hook assembly protein FlgD